jgi:ubiquinone/menaquinone biosynthesis C-methylase UbiE/uncharacterized protein YbaR (Trm112 family)
VSIGLGVIFNTALTNHNSELYYKLSSAMNINVSDLICCPVCKGRLTQNLNCTDCARTYSVIENIPILIDKFVSRNEWKWVPVLFNKGKIKDITRQYQTYLNDETKKAQKSWWQAMEHYLDDFHGIVIDIAAGLGGMLNKLMELPSDIFPIVTDVDPNTLIYLINNTKKKHQRPLAGVATDAKYLAFKDNTADHITSCSGFNNIPQVKLAFQEVYRVMKKNAKLAFMHSYYDENSRSSIQAKQTGIGIFNENNLVTVLKQIGFRSIKSEIIASALWAENPMDMFPVTGDRQYFAIIQAQKNK